MAVISEGLRAEYRSMAENGHELVMLAAREVVSHGRAHTLDRVKQLLDAWREKGLTTVSAANAYLGEVEKLNAQIRMLMEVAGASGGCTKANRDNLTQWQSQWHMPQEMILLAAEFAHGKDKPMAYMHKLLSGWHEQGIANLADARAEHEKRTAQPKGESKPAPAAKRVVEQQYAQRDYDPDEFDEIPEDQLEEMNRK